MPKKQTSKPFLLIAGPCVMEGLPLALKIARKVKEVAHDLGWKYVFKASYDKANRTSVQSHRGPGLKAGLEMLAEVSSSLGIPVTTDVHTVEEVEIAAKYVDILQIPAFLCRQTDLVLAAAKTGKSVNVKKGQFLAPWDVKSISEKLKVGGCTDYWITERGTSFGYNNLVVDMRGLVWMREEGHPVIFDATHSVQRPGGLGSSSGGDGRLAPVLARAAMAVGIDGLFLETHPTPETAPSDGPNMIPLAKLPRVLKQLANVRLAVQRE